MTAETMLELARMTREINDANGFQPTTYDRLPIVLCLIHSEISEAFIERGCGGFQNPPLSRVGCRKPPRAPGFGAHNMVSGNRAILW